MLTEEAVCYLLSLGCCRSAGDSGGGGGGGGGADGELSQSLCVVYRTVVRSDDGGRMAVVPLIHAAHCAFEGGDSDSGGGDSCTVAVREDSAAVREASEQALLRSVEREMLGGGDTGRGNSGRPPRFEYNLWRIGEVDVLVRCPQRAAVLHRATGTGHQAFTDTIDPSFWAEDSDGSVEVLPSAQAPPPQRATIAVNVDLCAARAVPLGERDADSVNRNIIRPSTQASRRRRKRATASLAQSFSCRQVGQSCVVRRTFSAA